jgi:hypothetical protein
MTAGASERQDLLKALVPLKSGDERIHVIPLEEDLYQVNNFVALGEHIAPLDIVRCGQSLEGCLQVIEVVRRGPLFALGLTFEGKYSPKVDDILNDLQDLGCRFEPLVRGNFGVGVPRDRWSEVLQYLETTPAFVGWKIVSGPDSPTPFGGPFDPMEEE